MNDLKNFEVKKETVKALLITDGTKEMWIQRKWLRADGTLTPKAAENWASLKTKEQQAAELKEFRTANGHTYNTWSPSGVSPTEYRRLYFEDGSFIGVKTEDRQPNGYYESHRYAKGERVSVTFFTAKNGLAKELLPHLSIEQYQAYTPSGQSKILVEKPEGGYKEIYI